MGAKAKFWAKIAEFIDRAQRFPSFGQLHSTTERIAKQDIVLGLG